MLTFSFGFVLGRPFGSRIVFFFLTPSGGNKNIKKREIPPPPPLEMVKGELDKANGPVIFNSGFSTLFLFVTLSYPLQ